MDKFGFFNLFNTILNEVNKKNTAQNEKVDVLSPAENTSKQDKQVKRNNTAILNIINSHDQFVKRVMKNNKNNN